MTLPRSIIFIICIHAFLGSAFAQPANFYSDGFINNPTFTNYPLTAYGKLRQCRIQASVNLASSVGRWFFYAGTFSPKWCPYTVSNMIPSFDSIIDPALTPGSARYNAAVNPPGFNFGEDGRLPAIVSGRYYTINIGDVSNANNFMAIWETTFNPTTLSSVVQSPVQVCAGGSPIDIYIKASSTLNAVERGYLRYSNSSNFASSSLVSINFNDTLGKATIPAQPLSTTIYYYVFTSKLSLSQLAPGGAVNETYCDLSTLTMNNNGGINYQFTVTSGTLPSSLSFTPSLACNGVAVVLTASASNGNTYAWDFGNLLSSYSASNTINRTFTTLGNNAVTLRVRHTSGCEQSLTQNISVGSLPNSQILTPTN
jgi:hypothetical protein